MPAARTNQAHLPIRQARDMPATTPEKNNRPNKQSKGGNNITFADLHHECKTSTTSTGTSDGMKTTNHCLKFDSFLLLSSQPDLVALGKENGYEFMRGELE